MLTNPSNFKCMHMKLGWNDVGYITEAFNILLSDSYIYWNVFNHILKSIKWLQTYNIAEHFKL